MGSRALTGIRPTGTPHLGNYLAMLRPALGMAKEHEVFCPIVDYHGLIDVRDPQELAARTIEAAAVIIALGFDAERHHLYRQSDIPEVFELAGILACLTPKGLLNRGHAYKSAIDENRAVGKPDDSGINAGLFNYPVLMAADILLFEADRVPVGSENRQHLEIARDVIKRMNQHYDLSLTIPEAVIEDDVATIVGLDGRKMSKSYGNVIPIFAGTDTLRGLVMGIVTDSKATQEPKDPERCNVFALLEHFAHPTQVAEVRRRYLKGGMGYAEAKEILFDCLESTFGDARGRFGQLMAHPEMVQSTLKDGASRIRGVASTILERIREAVGIRRFSLGPTVIGEPLKSY